MRSIGDIADVQDVPDVRLVQPASNAVLVGAFALVLILGGVLYFRARR